MAPIYDRYRKATERAIRHACLSLRLSAVDAEDLRQDIWVYLLINELRIGEAFVGRSAYTTYLSRIIINYGRNWVRAKGRAERRFVSLEALLEIPRQGRSAAFTSGQDEGTQAQRLELDALSRVLATVDRAHRILLWRWAAGKPLSNVAAELGITRNAVSCRLSRLFRIVRTTVRDQSALRQRVPS